MPTARGGAKRTRAASRSPRVPALPGSTLPELDAANRERVFARVEIARHEVRRRRARRLDHKSNAARPRRTSPRHWLFFAFVRVSAGSVATAAAAAATTVATATAAATTTPEASAATTLRTLLSLVHAQRTAIEKRAV